jgi:hypothetical protein
MKRGRGYRVFNIRLLTTAVPVNAASARTDGDKIAQGFYDCATYYNP